jgi:hypothetical protein
MASFGTLTWIDRTGGRMSALDRLRLTAQAVQARAKRRFQRQRRSDRRVEDILPPRLSAEKIRLYPDGADGAVRGVIAGVQGNDASLTND